MSKTAIIASIKTLDLDATKRILEARPSLLTVTDRHGFNLLHLACAASPAKLRVSAGAQTRMVKFLLDRGFAIDLPVGRDACTPLFFAVARARNPALVRLLLARGAKATAAPGGGLFAAGWWEDITNLKLVIDAGARIDIVVGVTPFLACWCWKRFAAAKYLAERGADVNYQDRRGKTALHHGVEKEFDPRLLRWLVAHGASPHVSDHDGVSPRLKASRKRDRRFFAALARE
ncbi:MAG TPA: ankyrin repeat domain-containing protein [Gemmatimonadales bacterium]